MGRPSGLGRDAGARADGRAVRLRVVDPDELRIRPGGDVRGVTPQPGGDRRAFLWSPRRFPMFYRVGIDHGDGRLVLSSGRDRVWGPLCWSPTGRLAVGGFAGGRKVVFEVDPVGVELRLLAEDAGASLEPSGFGPAGDLLCRRYGLGGAVADQRWGPDGVETLAELRLGSRLWRAAEIVRWNWQGHVVEGIFVPPPTGRRPWPVVMFLNGGPVGALAAGQADSVGAWADARWATFIPEFPASGICGEEAMLAAFRADGFGDDLDAAFAGLDGLITAGRADGDRQFVVGHSYGATLVNEAITTRPARFRAAVSWEGVADYRRLDPLSLQMQSEWRGGQPQDVPHRWISPLDRVETTSTPLLLVYGDQGPLVEQGRAFHAALAGVGVDSALVVHPDAGHLLETDADIQDFRARVGSWFSEHGL